MEAQTNSNDTGIIKSIKDSIIPLLSILLIFMLLVDWAFSSFMNNPLQSNTRTVGYGKIHERLGQQVVISDEGGTKVLGSETCIDVHDFQTEHIKQRETTMVTLVPIRKILE